MSAEVRRLRRPGRAAGYYDCSGAEMNGISEEGYG